MKRIACISTINGLENNGDFSSSLMDLYNSTRVHNRENDITGVFIISGSNCLQIMEGNATSVANAIYRMGRDKRISDLSVVMNCNEESPEYRGWNIRFINAGTGSHLEFITKLKKKLANKITAKTRSDHERLAQLFNDSTNSKKTSKITPLANTSAAENFKPASSYKKHVLSISSWPRPNQLKMSPELISLCSNLMRRPIHFERILSLKICASEKNLVLNLAALDDIGLLKQHIDNDAKNINQADSRKTSPTNTSSTSRKSSDRFSRVLRRFIATTKH
ncbi:Uncharacterised protein [Zhongshania aliphaticivorans]|uniref:BLUF domain-containing protein n=1 Tax=Zhongshania aliphaticivorans TaxID=1470434 RepID=A0A5S9PXS4_9GAMM|nr:BLUF domain-containing protein [Zhongshania aliphaticivorans]CAA0092556.1 Uncharacterised protein [Zhongshania aliphaticivorans]CAA0109857.1 Uncharacterised protein [Zhongshania aliphaticivorans]